MRPYVGRPEEIPTTTRTVTTLEKLEPIEQSPPNPGIPDCIELWKLPSKTQISKRTEYLITGAVRFRSNSLGR